MGAVRCDARPGEGEGAPQPRRAPPSTNISPPPPPRGDQGPGAVGLDPEILKRPCVRGLHVRHLLKI